MSQLTFDEWFSQLTGYQSPYIWQRNLAGETRCYSRLIRIPTGFGKTEGVLAVWSYHRLHRNDSNWPRRLIWCLPMRVLVEQTQQVAIRLVDKIAENCRPGVYMVMGGEDSGEWFLYPERPAILVGTQDMLLSRALNRGYASPRARWPSEFGLLHQDCLWIMDEVQLMDVGLATSAQLQAFRDQDQAKHLRSCYTWWMSATLQANWLESVDTKEYHSQWVAHPCTIPENQRSGGLWNITKTVQTEAIPSNKPDQFAKLVLEHHKQLKDGAFGKITLVICNTVERACQTYEALSKKYRGDIRLIHSRFRPAERERWRVEFLDRKHCQAGVERIIVSTQVVEAGVDISAGCLITELAPWPSLVQRFGRCARYGGTGQVVVVARRRGKEDDAAPYQPASLAAAWQALQQLTDVGINALEDYEHSLAPEVRQQLYAYSPSHLLIRREFDELFDTTPDLTGADLDISRYIRSDDDRDLQVFWLDIPADHKGQLPQQPPDNYKPRRRELCAIPYLLARQWLLGETSKGDQDSNGGKKRNLRAGMRAWLWDWQDGRWVEVSGSTLLPGRVVCVASHCGGYHPTRGFDMQATDPVTPVDTSEVEESSHALQQADDQQDGEQLSMQTWKTIAWHSKEVAEQVQAIAAAIGLNERLSELLELAALWHDWGKSHPAFQGAIRGNQRPNRCDIAKAPREAWYRPPPIYRYLDDSETRPAFRHELASALGLFALLRQFAVTHAALLGPWLAVLPQMGYQVPNGQHESPAPCHRLIERLLGCCAEEFDLVAYLVASHHGKVRLGLHAAPADQDYQDCDGRGLPIRGVREGDRLPSVPLVPHEPPLPEVTLTLEPAKIGLSPITGRSWQERCLGLKARYGTCTLALLEAILRAADVRASRLTTPDPSLAT
jgi:CRISPR-associated endonuclease/helicase Cas3